MISFGFSQKRYEYPSHGLEELVFVSYVVWLAMPFINPAGANASDAFGYVPTDNSKRSAIVFQRR